MRVINLLLVVHSLERDWGHLKGVKFEILVPEYQANFGPWTTKMWQRQSGAAISRASHWNGHFFGYLQTQAPIVLWVWEIGFRAANGI